MKNSTACFIFVGLVLLCLAAGGHGKSSNVSASSSSYVSVARQDALNVGINPDHFVSQIQQESGFNPNASSPAGAIGIAQFMPATAAGMGVNPYNPVAALAGAARLDASHIRMYGGDEAKGYAAYNAGPGTVNGAVARCGIGWEQCIPAETQNYIHNILG